MNQEQPVAEPTDKHGRLIAAARDGSPAVTIHARLDDWKRGQR